MIAFIMDNFIVIVIIVGIIYSMFFRKSPLENPPNRMPDFGKGGANRPGDANKRNVITPRQLNQKPLETQFPASEGAYQPSERIDQLVMATLTDPEDRPVPPKRPSRAPSTSRHSVQASKKVNTSVWSNKIQPDDLARGVIWAEILGPPRAKRPFRR